MAATVEVYEIFWSAPGTEDVLIVSGGGGTTADWAETTVVDPKEFDAVTDERMVKLVSVFDKT